MDTQMNESQGVKTLRSKFFLTNPKSSKCFSLIGTEPSTKAKLLRELTEEYCKKEHPKVFYVFYSVSDVKGSEGAASPYRCFWTNVISAIATEVTVTKLHAAMTLSEASGEEILQEIQAIYDMMKTGEGLSDIDTGKKVRRLFTLYTKLGVQILLALDAFEAVDTVFPYDAERNDDSGRYYLFNDLFALSGKGGMRLNLSILLISCCRIGTLQRKVGVGSDVELAYSIIRI